MNPISIQMNNRPLYENLDTAFVNLSALVKYLRQREFIGRIRVELSSYEADITLYEGNKISVREHDKISGRISDGEQAFQRLIIRAREAGGTIHVYQKVAEAPKKVETPKKMEVPKTEIVTTPQIAPTPSAEKIAPIPKPVEAIEPIKVAAAAVVENGNGTKPVKVAEVQKKPVPVVNLPKFPFDLHNNVESKARRKQLSTQDWETLVGLTGELLGTIDKSLAEAKLDFKAAFAKSRSEISADYPFLDPSGKIFEYANEKVTMNEQVNAKLFVTSIIESLHRILDKLGANSKFAGVYRNTTQRILALMNQRKTFYDKFSITPQLKKILGV